MQGELSVLEERLGYSFGDPALIGQALVHSSYANEKGPRHLSSYERLEFLGDAVLQLIISDYLYARYPDFPEGELTKLRSRIVCEATLVACAKALGLGEYMSFGRGEEMTGGRERASILADCFEAVVAAIYLDGGMSSARSFVLRNMERKVMDAVMGKIFIDYKTRLQEVIQARKITQIRYQVVGEQGPDHSKTFEMHVLINDQVVGTGSGRSKKEAEQMAAKMALERVSTLFPA